MCMERTKAGLPSTNFIWGSEVLQINENLEFMTKLSGMDSVINVTPAALSSKIGKKLMEYKIIESIFSFSKPKLGLIKFKMPSFVCL